MKQVIFLILGLVLAFQQVFGATIEELEAVYAEFANSILELVDALNEARTNYSNNFVQDLALQHSDAKLELENRVNVLNEKIAKLAASGDYLRDVNVTQCGAYIIDDISDYANRVLETVDICLNETKYGIGLNLLNTVWIEITKLATSYLSCAARSIANCGGDAVCGDEALASIQEQIEEALNALRSLGAVMLNTLDGFSVNCKEHYLVDFDYYAADMLEFVASCVNIIIKNAALPVCAV